MTNGLQVITVQNVRCYVDDNNVAWLNAEDVARGLGFVQVEEKLSTTDGRKTYTTVRWARVNNYLAEFGYPSKVGKDDFLPENMFYRLAMKASNTAAQIFQAKVADEILPSIRKNGLYINPNAPIDPRFLRRMADELEQRDKQIAALTSQVAELKPAAEYCRLILQSQEALPITVIAKDYGMAPAAFNELLHKLKIQYKVGRTWVLYQLYASLGYTKTVTQTLKNGLVTTMSYWTQKGRMFLYSMLKKENVLPVIERKSPMAILF